MRNDDLLSKSDIRPGVSTLIRVTKCLPGTYLEQRTPEEQREIFQKALEEQKNRPAEPVGASVAAVHTDKLYTGWDPGLRAHTRGRTHRRELMRTPSVNFPNGRRCVGE